MRAMTEADRPAVDALVARNWAHDRVMHQAHAAHGAPPSVEPLRRTLVVERDGTVVAAGSTFESTLHPTRRFVTIDVAPQWRRRGLGSALLAELRSLAGGAPSVVKARPSDEAWAGFLRRHGFAPIVRTRTGSLDAGRHAGWIVRHLDPPDGVVLEPMRDLVPFARLLATLYREAHGWAPMGPVDDERAMALFGAPLLAGTSFVARSVPTGRADGAGAGSREAGAGGRESGAGDRDAGEAIGAIGLIADPWGGPDAYLVHAGVLACSSADRDAVCRSLVARALAAAAEQELRVALEADDTYLTWAPAAELLGDDLVDDLAAWVDG